MPSISISTSSPSVSATGGLRKMPTGLTQLVHGDDAGKDGAERIEALAAEPLAVLELEVARAHVVCACVARDGGERVLGGHAPGLTPDHDRELGLRVHVLTLGRQDEGIARAPEGVGELGKEERRLRQLDSLLGRVIVIVEPDTNDLGRLAATEALPPETAHLLKRH